jgi:dTDP-4-dehydrorhamnose 3,5-epimerase
MNIIKTRIEGLLVIEPRVYSDARGSFYESFNARDFSEATGGDVAFVQDNHSTSARNVLRGLHYQIRQAQGKLVRVTAGEVFDVAADIRSWSPTFGRWYGCTLSAENRRQMWIPAGFAHGFLVLSESAEFLYKVTDYRAAEHERCIRWDDPQLGIDWPLQGSPVLSAKDAEGLSLAASDLPLLAAAKNVPRNMPQPKVGALCRDSRLALTGDGAARLFSRRRLSESHA